MIKIDSGIFDRTRLVSNILMLVLLAGNIFFSIQYTENVKEQLAQEADNTNANATHYVAVHALNDFINIVLKTKGVVSYDDRVKLENDIIQVDDPTLTSQWQAFTASNNSSDAQEDAIAIMSTLAAKSI